MVIVQSRFRVANGLESLVREAFIARPRLVDRAPGFLGMETFTDTQHPEIFYLITRWVDERSYRQWHVSEDHRKSHAGIPPGLKLDPSFTKVITGERIEPAAVAPSLDTVVADSARLLETFLTQSASTCCVVVSTSGTIRYCNGAFDELLETSDATASGQAIAGFLTEVDAARLAAWPIVERAMRSTPVPLNFLRRTGMPFTLRCHIDVQGDDIVIIGEPDHGANAAMQHVLVDLNNQLAVSTREIARQKRELEQTHWHLKKISEVLPMCVECGKVKTGAATWEEVRTFLLARSRFLSHGYCPECLIRASQAEGLE